MDVLASAIMNALEVGSKYGVDPKVLLTPRIAEMRVSWPYHQGVNSSRPCSHSLATRVRADFSNLQQAAPMCLCCGYLRYDTADSHMPLTLACLAEGARTAPGVSPANQHQ